MFVRNCMDNIACALENCTTKVKNFYSFLKGLSVKNKISFDIQLRSDKSPVSIWRNGFSVSKQWRLMPVTLVILGMVSLFASIKMLFKKN